MPSPCQKLRQQPRNSEYIPNRSVGDIFQGLHHVTRSHVVNHVQCHNRLCVVYDAPFCGLDFLCFFTDARTRGWVFGLSCASWVTRARRVRLRLTHCAELILLSTCRRCEAQLCRACFAKRSHRARRSPVFHVIRGVVCFYVDSFIKGEPL